MPAAAGATVGAPMGSACRGVSKVACRRCGLAMSGEFGQVKTAVPNVGSRSAEAG